jgi:activating signal cointegrator complex subunit 2
MEEIKADILRRAEAMTLGGDDDEVPYAATETSKWQKSAMVLAYDDEDLDGESKVKIGGDGEESGQEEEEREEKRTEEGPETILELAYIRDPKLFDRDAMTRRSKGREELRVQTGMQLIFHIEMALTLLIANSGWVDEQIEGWRIMLERNVGPSQAIPFYVSLTLYATAKEG